MQTPTTFNPFPALGSEELDEMLSNYWRLQREAEAMPQEEYEGPKGERLNLRQGELAERLESALGDPSWMSRPEWRR